MSDESSPVIPWEHFAAFIRQATHDLRNQLNAAELQSALISELTEDPELKPEVKRLRELVSQMGSSLQLLSTLVAPPRPSCITYAVTELLEDLREKIDSKFPNTRVNWRVELDASQVEVDPQLIEQALVELFDNATRHAPADGDIHVDVRAAGKALLIIIREAKNAPVERTDSWGADPIRTVAHGHYGLGLRRARAIIEAHGGELRAEYDAKTSALVTTLRLPLGHRI